MSCFYCDNILSGKEQVKKLYESENLLGYYHTKPVYEKHIVIVPKLHIADLLATTEEHNKLVLEVISVAKEIIKKFGKQKGVRLITNLGEFQDEPHLHFHLIFGQRT